MRRRSDSEDNAGSWSIAERFFTGKSNPAELLTRSEIICTASSHSSMFYPLPKCVATIFAFLLSNNIEY